MVRTARILSAGALAFSLVLLTACQAHPTFIPSIFQITKEQEGVAISASGDPATTGVLTISVKGFLDDIRTRHVLATVADVERVEVTVTASDGRVFSQSIVKAAMTAGQLTATFTGVPVGTAAVTMEAFDISGQLIGSNSRSTTVIAGSTTSVSVPLTLNPTVLPTVGGSGGGTSSPSTGGVAVNGTLSDGYTMQAFAIGSAPSLALAVDPNGDDKWILTGDGSSSANLVHLAAAGTLLKTYPLINVQFRSVFIDSQGTVRVFGPQNDEYLDQATDTVIGDGTRYSGYAAAAPDGTWWQSFLADTRVEQRSSSGASLQLVDAGFAPSDLALSPDGSLWVLHDNWDPQASLPGVITTARFDGAGNQLASVVLDTVGDSIATDSQGNAWLGTFEGLVKVAPDGSVLGTYLNTFVSDAIVDAQDRVWALGVGRLYHVDTGGEILATLDMPAAVDLSNTTSFTPASSGASLAFDSLGDLWVDCGATSVVKVDVP